MLRTQRRFRRSLFLVDRQHPRRQPRGERDNPGPGLKSSSVVLSRTGRRASLPARVSRESKLAPAVAEPAAPRSDLLPRLRRREHQAQRQVYLAHQRALQVLAASVLRCAAEAEALVADVLTDFLYRYVDTLQREESIEAYLRMMTTRRARRHLDMQRRAREVNSRDMAAEPDLPAVAEGAKWQRWVDDCLAALADKPRQLLRLHFGHDLSLSEIGQQLGITKQAVSKTVLKSLALLRRCLRGKGAPMLDGPDF